MILTIAPLQPTVGSEWQLAATGRAELRTVFVLFELEELSAPEVAGLTGLPVGTVASRLRRAREEFQLAARRVRAHATQATRGRP